MHATKILSLLPLLVAAAMAAPTPAPAPQVPANVDIEVDIERNRLGGRPYARPYPDRCSYYPNCNNCNSCNYCPDRCCNYYPSYPSRPGYPGRPSTVDIDVEVNGGRPFTRGYGYPCTGRFRSTDDVEEKKIEKRGDSIVIEEHPVIVCNTCLQGGKCCRDPKCANYRDNCCYDDCSYGKPCHDDCSYGKPCYDDCRYGRPCYDDCYYDKPCYDNRGCGYCCNGGYAKGVAEVEKDVEVKE